MKKPINARNTVSQKTNVNLLLFGLLFGFGSMNAQNASHDQNSIPINGNNCTSYGRGALQNNAVGDSYNTATGWNALNANNGGNDNTATGAEAMGSNTSGNYNTANGRVALFSNTTGHANVAIGDSSLFYNTTDGNTGVGTSALLNNSSGIQNTAVGIRALYKNTSGLANTAIGNLALYSNTTGSENTAFGDSILYSNTTGARNTGIGCFSLRSNVSGVNNIAIGYSAVRSNVSGLNNIGIGIYALRNTTSSHNIGIGSGALQYNTSGINNIGIGLNAGAGNSSGSGNTCLGNAALQFNTGGSRNVAIGHNALFFGATGGSNTAVGNSAMTGNTGDFNTSLGFASGNAAAGLTNATSIGANAASNANNKIRLGDANVTVIEGQVAYTFPSDGRFKDNIREEDVKGLEFILKLRPVVYNFDTKRFTEFLTKNMEPEIRSGYLARDYKASTAIRQSGFIAQEVEKAATEVGYDFNGVHKPNDDNDNYSIAYSQFVVPLVKSVQQQQKMIDEQNKTIEQLKHEVEAQKLANEALADKLAVTTSLSQLNTGVEGFSMDQNEPNPFTHETSINYNLPKNTAKAQLVVFDLSGKQITTFEIDPKSNGTLTINAAKLVAGIYLYSIVADGKALSTKRMMVGDK